MVYGKIGMIKYGVCSFISSSHICWLNIKLNVSRTTKQNVSGSNVSNLACFFYFSYICFCFSHWQNPTNWCINGITTTKCDASHYVRHTKYRLTNVSLTDVSTVCWTIQLTGYSSEFCSLNELGKTSEGND
jgi:hypothetical protein